MKNSSWVVLVVFCGVLIPTVEAGVGSVIGKGARKAVTAVARTVGREGAETAAETGAKVLARKACRELGEEAAKLCVRYGDDAARFIVRHGDDGVRFLRRFGDDGLRMVTRYGDDAAGVLVKHPGVGADLVQVGGKNAVVALKKLDGPAAIQLARKTTELVQKGQLDEVLRVISKSPGPVTSSRVNDILDVVLRHSVKIGAGVAIVAVGVNAADAIGAPADTIRGTTEVLTNKLNQLSPEVVVDKAGKMVKQIVWGCTAIMALALVLIFRRRRPPMS